MAWLVRSLGGNQNKTKAKQTNNREHYKSDSDNRVQCARLTYYTEPAIICIVILMWPPYDIKSSRWLNLLAHSYSMHIMTFVHYSNRSICLIYLQSISDQYLYWILLPLLNYALSLEFEFWKGLVVVTRLWILMRCRLCR